MGIDGAAIPADSEKTNPRLERRGGGGRVLEPKAVSHADPDPAKPPRQERRG